VTSSPCLSVLLLFTIGGAEYSRPNRVSGRGLSWSFPLLPHSRMCQSRRIQSLKLRPHLPFLIPLVIHLQPYSFHPHLEAPVYIKVSSHLSHVLFTFSSLLFFSFWVSSSFDLPTHPSLVYCTFSLPLPFMYMPCRPHRARFPPPMAISLYLSIRCRVPFVFSLLSESVAYCDLTSLRMKLYYLCLA